jgi:hypothetical protein
MLGNLRELVAGDAAHGPPQATFRVPAARDQHVVLLRVDVHDDVVVESDEQVRVLDRLELLVAGLITRPASCARRRRDHWLSFFLRNRVGGVEVFAASS